MKRYRTIPALLALIALLVPCTHGFGHQHDTCTPETACIAAHPACHACTKTPCSDKMEILPLNSISMVELPDHPVSVVYMLQTTEWRFEPVFVPDVTLIQLKTIQLLI